jgi:aryl-alcohol dehydrogenase-like predicted oxidoreductase
MRFNTLGESCLNVSAVGIGTWAIGGDFFGSVDEQQAIEGIRAGIDAGINLIDTSPAYGLNYRSEIIVGKALQGYRNRAIISTKLGVLRGSNGEFIKTLDPQSMYKEVEQSLRNLRTDVIDLYQVHWPDNQTPMEQVGTALAKMQKDGKIRYIGVSNFDTVQIDDLSQYCNIVSLQPQYSLLCRDIEKDILPYCCKNNIGVLSYGSLGAGMLTGKFKQPLGVNRQDVTDIRDAFYPFLKEEGFWKALKLVEKVEAIATRLNKPVGQVAINWVSQQPGITCALVGIKNARQAIENATAGNWLLSNYELAELDVAWQDIYGQHCQK